MKSFEQFAKTAYEAYCKQAFGSVPVATWDEIGPKCKAGWIAAVKQVVADFMSIH